MYHILATTSAYLLLYFVESWITIIMNIFIIIVILLIIVVIIPSEMHYNYLHMNYYQSREALAATLYDNFLSSFSHILTPNL